VESDRLPWTQLEEDGELSFAVDTALYSVDAIQRAAYWLSDRCYVRLEPAQSGSLRVRLVARDEGASLKQLAGEFGNRLLDEQVRRQISLETAAVRDLLVRQAFVEADFGDEGAGDSDQPERSGA